MRTLFMTTQLALLRCLLGAALVPITTASLPSQVAIRGKVLHTMAGPAIEDGMVIIRDGKVASVGRAADMKVPDGFQLLEAAVVTPGLVDAHSVVGLAGQYNQAHDQDQLESSQPLQPELRAIDAYNPRERLVEWLRGFGVTTIHTGHAPGELISGQTAVFKTSGDTVDQALVAHPVAVAVTLGESAKKGDAKSPGTRGKMMALLRARLIQAQEYQRKVAEAPADKKPDRDLGLEVLGRVLKGEIPLLITAHRAQDISSALRLADELKLKIILDGAAEANLVADSIKTRSVPVILHPQMARASGELRSASYETAAKLRQAGIRVALQSGYESYVPKTRVVLYEAAIAAANGLTFQEALATITIDAARILSLDSRLGSLEIGKDGDVALYDGDPFEYTSHCVGVVINGRVVSTSSR